MLTHALRIDLAASYNNLREGLDPERLQRHIEWELDQLHDAGIEATVQIAAGHQKPPAPDFLQWARRVPSVQVTADNAQTHVQWRDAIAEAAPRHRTRRAA